MKRFIFIMTLFMSLFCVTNASAQSNTEVAMRQYSFWDNWFTSLNAGGSYSLFDTNSDGKFWNHVRPTVGLSVGKWTNPKVGFRLNGELGFNSSVMEIYNNGVNFKDGSTFTHWGVFGDAMFNLTNIIGTYKEDRMFELVAFGGLGYVHGCQDEFVGTTNNLALRGGLQLNMNLSDAWQLNLEPSITALDDEFNGIRSGNKYDAYVNLTLGVTYRFKNWDGNRGFKLLTVYDEATVDGLNKQINLLRETNDAQKALVANQAKMIEMQEKELADAKECCEKNSKLVTKPTINSVVTFKINESSIEESEKVHVFNAAKVLKDNDKLNVVINGYADANTGTAEFNKELSDARANAVKKMLINEFGIDESRIKVVANGSDSQVFDNNDWNRVVIFVTE